MNPSPSCKKHTDDAANDQPHAHPVAEPELSLESLLAQVTEDNLHAEIDTGPAVGREA